MKKAFSIFKGVASKGAGLLPFVLAFVFVAAMTDAISQYLSARPHLGTGSAIQDRNKLGSQQLHF